MEVRLLTDHLARPARRERSALLVVDVQERLLPVIDDHDNVLKQCVRMVRAAKLLEVPVLSTEQYPKGLGPTVEPLANLLKDTAVREKLSFSCCGPDGVADELSRLGRPQVVVVGIEAHVCVAQTVLDLLSAGLSAFVAADATSSRRALDRWVALDRMRQAGAVVTTTEAVIFEWLRTAAAPQFKDVARLVLSLIHI